MATIYDVAKEANVSPSTVSRVINNSSVVSASTRKRVLEAISILGYDMNNGYNVSSERVILVISDVMRSEYYNALYHAISEQGFQMLHFFFSEDASAEEDLLRFLQQMLPLQRIAGILLDNFDHANEDPLSMTISKVPTVLINSQCPVDPCVTIGIDYYQTSYVATKYLLDLGCHRITIFHSGHSVASGRISSLDHQRISGYRTALSEHGVPFNDSLLLESDFLAEGSFETTMRYLQKSAQIPDAFVCPFDVMATGCLRAIQKSGYRVPEDIKLVSLMDDWFASFVTPSISSIHYPLEQIAHEAVRLLCSQIRGDKLISQDVRIPFTFIPREST